MQASKISVMMCAAAICASPLLVRAADTEAEAKLRAVLREKMAEQGAPVKPVVTTPKMEEVKPVDTAPVADAGTQEKLRAVLREKMAEQGAPMKPVVTTPKMEEVKPVDNSRVAAEKEALKQSAKKENAKVKQVETQPVVNPDLPLSADKQIRLNALLEQYKADKITPQEYHEQKAKILAEP
jgi:hypothetical protein